MSLVKKRERARFSGGLYPFRELISVYCLTTSDLVSDSLFDCHRRALTLQLEKKEASTVDSYRQWLYDNAVKYRWAAFCFVSLSSPGDPSHLSS